MSAEAIPAPRTTPEEHVVALLRAHVPLSLLFDLALLDPQSSELYENERVTPS